MARPFAPATNVGIPGHPSTCTEELRKKIVSACLTGVHPYTAARMHGVANRTFADWMARGRDGEEPFSSFIEEIEKSIAECEFIGVAQVAGGATGSTQGDWRAAAHLLERRFPERWGRQDQLKISGDPDAPIEVTKELKLDPESLAAVTSLVIASRTGMVPNSDTVIDVPAKRIVAPNGKNGTNGHKGNGADPPPNDGIPTYRD